MMKVLVTGGAGFIGSHTVDLLLENGYNVRILDSLQPRVHPRGKPPWVPKEVLEALRPPPYRLWAIHRLIRRDSIGGDSLPVGNGSERFLHLLLADSALESLNMAFRAFLPGREWLKMRYSVEGPRLYLYPLLHWLRVARLALLALW